MAAGKLRNSPVIKRILGLFLRIARGKNVLIAERTKEQWDAQYQKGKWDYLLEDLPPNAVFLAELISKIPSPRKILDVGCGNGGLLLALEKKGIPAEYVGVDYSEEAILLAQERFPKKTFFVGDAREPKKEWGKDFTVVVFSEVLYYVPAVETLAKYRPLLAPNGIILVSMYRSWRTMLLAWKLKFSGHVRQSFSISPERGYGRFIVLEFQG